MGLSQEQIDFFHENGYLAYGPMLSEQEIQTCRREYDLEFEKANRNNTYRNLTVNDTSSLDEKRNAPQQMLQIMQMCERNLHFRKLLYNPQLLDIVQDLIGPNIMLFHDQALFKPARTGGAVFWHQDNAYWKCRPASLISCWMTLDPAWKENGAMQVIPGSHLKPVWHEQSESTDALLDIEKQVDTARAVTIDLPAGGCMFHHCQTLHYTQPNETDQQRRAFVIHYMVPGTRSDTGGGRMAVGFGKPLLRMAI